MGLDTVTGYTHPDGFALCVECAAKSFTQEQMDGSATIDANNGDHLHPVFISSEGGYAPSCDVCHEVIDCTVICGERASEHPTLTLNDDGEYIQVDSQDNRVESDDLWDAESNAWTEYNMRGYLDQTQCDCCGRMVQYAHVSPDGSEAYCRNCVTIV